MERAETGAELCCNSGPFACASVSETEAEDNAKEEHHDEVLAEFYEGGLLWWLGHECRTITVSCTQGEKSAVMAKLHCAAAESCIAGYFT